MTPAVPAALERRVAHAFRMGLLIIVLILATPFSEARATRIQEARFVTLGGIDQWITLRGADRGKPILLVLHGGPAEASSPLVAQYAPFESDFVVVQWDQRGGGKTFMHAGSTPQPTSLDLLMQDTIELTEYLQKYLNNHNVILLGHSWGSSLGVSVIRRRPELFRAFVGTGQVVSWKKSLEYYYRYTLARARAEPNPAGVAEIEALGVPEVGNQEQYLAMRKWLNRYFAPADLKWLDTETQLMRKNPQATPEVVKAYVAGYQNSMAGLSTIIFSTDFTVQSHDFKVPFFIIQGRDDHLAPTELVTAYFESIRAPHKQLTLIDGAGHFAMMTHTPQFLAALLEDVHSIDH